MRLLTKLRNAWRGESRATLRDPEEWMWEAFGATPTDTGERITRDKALTVSGLWRGINLLAFATAKVPLHVMVRTDNDGKEKAKNHPAFPTLRHRFNPYLTAYRGKSLLTFHRCIHGNGYALIDRTVTPWQLIPLDPTTTYPIRANGRLWYVIEIPIDIDEDGRITRYERRRVEASDVFHLIGLSFDGLAGLDVLTVAKNGIGMSLAARKFGAKYFENSAQHSLALECPASVPKDYGEALLRDWNAIRAGLEKAHKVALLQHGVKANVISSTAKEAQLVELRQFELLEVANFIGVPPHMLGSTVNSSYASLEMERQRFLDDSLDPLLCAWEDEGNEKLLREREKRADTHVVEAKREAVVTLDYKTKVDGSIALANNGAITDNELRAIHNLPSRGPDGDRYRIPANIRYVDDDDEEETPTALPPSPQLPAPTPPAPTPDDDEASRRIDGARRCLEDAAGRMVTRLVGLARKGKPLDGERVTVAGALAPAILALIGEDRSASAAEWLIQQAPGTADSDELRSHLPRRLREYMETANAN
jgi:HK97 family phage portal protein